MKHFLFFLLCCFPLSFFAQGSLNMSVAGQYDDNSLPLLAGGAYNDIWGYAANGREYAIVGTIDGTLFIDITLPASPTVVAYEAGGAPGSIWRDYKTYGNYCYAVQDAGGGGARLQVFDLSGLPATVTKVHESGTFFQRAHNVFVEPSSGRLYVAGSNTYNTGIIVLDIQTNPANPTLLANLNLGRYSHDVYSHNDTLYCFMGNYGMDIWDLSNLSSPSYLGSMTAYPEKGYCHSGWATPDNRTLIFADETHDTGIKIADCTNPGTISVYSTFRSTLLAPTHTNSITHNQLILGNYCYVSYYHDGVVVFDISNPLAVSVVAYYDTEPANTNYSGYEGVWGVYPYLPSGRVIASDMLHGLFIFDMNLTLPVEFGKVSADWVQDQVVVHWETVSESQNEAFFVERARQDGLFEEIGRVEPLAEGGNGAVYRFSDVSPLREQAHYRIRQVDSNGKESYSEIVSLHPGKMIQLNQLYPNPCKAGADLFLNISAFEVGQVEVGIYDLMGKCVRRVSLAMHSGTNQLQIETGGILPGAYQVKVVAGSVVHTEKIIIQ